MEGEESVLRQRPQPQPSTVEPKADEVDSDGEDKIRLDSVADQIGQDKSSSGNQALEAVLGALPPRWRNWVIRGIFTWVSKLSAQFFSFLITTVEATYLIMPI